MRRAGAAVALIFATVLVALPVRADFKRIVRQIEREGNMRQRWIPFLSVARLAVKMNPVDGVSDFRLAVFEKNPLSVQRLDALVRESVTSGWNHVVQVRSRNGEQARIYARPAGRHVNLLIVARETDETVVVQMRIDPEKFAAMMAEPGGQVRVVGR